MSRSILAWLSVFFFSFLPEPSGAISLSCYRPASFPTNPYQDYEEVMVDCSLHGFGSREDLFFHKSNQCKTSPSLCDLITGFDYRFNAIRHLDKPRYEFPLISKLLFQHNNIQVIEDGAFSGGRLTLLDLSHNKISGDTLRKAVFRGKLNQSSGVYADSSLEKLFLGFNEIAYLTPDTFFYLKRLTTLYLNNNPLTVIGDTTARELQSLPRLSTLHLGSINVTRLPDSMFNKMKIESLYLNGNQLTQVPNMAPLGNSLLNLNLDNNQIRELKEHSFSRLRYLSALNMSANPRLRTIGKHTFRGLANLQTLYCNFNPVLAHVHPQAFNQEWGLREFYINNNALSSLPRDLGDWDNLDVLDIQSNPWTCDCSVRWLVDYLAKRQRTDPELNQNLHCSKPVTLSGMHLLSEPILSHISAGECAQGASSIISKLSHQFYKLYPLLFVLTVLLLVLVTYLLLFSYRYLRAQVPNVCIYTVQYNKLRTSLDAEDMRP